MRLLLFVFIFAFSMQTFAWGPRGHHTICDASVYLVKDKNFRQFLKGRPEVMGHLCNIPDTYWRSLTNEQTSLGNPGHYIDVEITGLKITDVPLDYQKIIKDYQGQDNKMKKGIKIKSVSSEFGSLWWRADQFLRRAIEAGELLKNAPTPKNSSEQQDQNLKFNSAIYQMIVNLGLLGHFVGDASMPYHGTYDYDGYGSGHGGIHLYYENEGVDEQDIDLVIEVVNAAKKLQILQKKPDFLTATNTIEKMKALSIMSGKEIADIEKIDPIVTPSKIETALGKEVRTSAQRKPISTIGSKFRPLIIAEMARSAALLSLLWDEAYEKIGKPDLSLYRSNQFPFMPEFVPPDYYR